MMVAPKTSAAVKKEPDFQLRFQIVYAPPKKADLRVFVVGNIVELGSMDQQKMRKNTAKVDRKILKHFQKYREEKAAAQNVKKEEKEDDDDDSEASNSDAEEDKVWLDNTDLLEFEDFFTQYFTLLQPDPDNTGIENLWSSDGHVRINSVGPGKDFVYSYYIYDFDKKRICTGDSSVTARQIRVPPFKRTNPTHEWTVRDKKLHDVSDQQFKPSHEFDDVELSDEGI